MWFNLPFSLSVFLSVSLSFVFYFSIVIWGLWVWVGSIETIGKRLLVYLRVKWGEKQNRKTELSKDWHWSKHRETIRIFKGTFFFFFFLFKNCCQSNKCWRLFAKLSKDIMMLRLLLHLSTLKGSCEHRQHACRPLPNKRKEVQRECALKKAVNAFKKFCESSSATWFPRQSLLLP